MIHVILTLVFLTRILKQVQGSTWVNLIQLYLIIIDMLKLEEGLGLPITVISKSMWIFQSI